MSIHPLPRVAAGVPSGGQFAASSRSESGISLSFDDHDTTSVATRLDAARRAVTRIADEQGHFGFLGVHGEEDDTYQSVMAGVRNDATLQAAMDAVGRPTGHDTAIYGEHLAAALYDLSTGADLETYDEWDLDLAEPGTADDIHPYDLDYETDLNAGAPAGFDHCDQCDTITNRWVAVSGLSLCGYCLEAEAQRSRR